MSSEGRWSRSSNAEGSWQGEPACWNSDGSPWFAVGLREGVAVGHQIEYEDGAVVYTEPFVKGVLHGLAKRFDVNGRLLLVSPFKRGTGIDFWCDERGRLAEMRPLAGGKPSGTERWWWTASGTGPGGSGATGGSTVGSRGSTSEASVQRSAPT